VKLAKFTIVTLILFIVTLILMSSVSRTSVSRSWWDAVESYMDDISESRIVDFYVDDAGDQTVIKFPLEKDITIERVTFFSDSTTSGDTTAIYFYNATAKVDSLVIPTGAQYLNKTTDFNLDADSAYILIKLDDTVWSGTAAGGEDGHVVVQYQVQRN